MLCSRKALESKVMISEMTRVMVMTMIRINGSISITLLEGLKASKSIS